MLLVKLIFLNLLNQFVAMKDVGGKNIRNKKIVNKTKHISIAQVNN